MSEAEIPARAQTDHFTRSQLGLLPRKWRICEIGSACSLVIDCPHTTPTFRCEGVLVARTTNIRDGRFVLEGASYVDEQEFRARIIRAEPQAGDVILTREAPVGEAFVVPPGMRVCLGQRVMLLRPDSSMLDSNYLLYQIYSGFVKSRIAMLTAGTTNPHLNVGEVRRFLLPVPSMAEQRRIAEILNTLDEAIQSMERLISKLEQAGQGVRHDLLTRGIDKSGELRDPATPHTFVNSELGLIPSDWRIVSVVDTASKSRGSLVIGPFGSDLVANDYRSSGVPVVFVRDVQPDDFSWVSDVYVSAQKAADLSAHAVCPGDLVITKMGLPPAIAAVYPDGLSPGVVTADIIRLRPDVEAVDPAWLSLAINSDSTRRQIAAITGGVTRPKITLRDFRRMLIALPPRSEQKAISDRVHALTAEVAAVRQERDKLLLLKRGLMDDLLTGRVLVGIPS